MAHPLSVSTILAAALVALATFAAAQGPALAADDCLSAPNAATPKGQHWYYHLDRATGRKCWYLRAVGNSEQKPARAAPAPASRSTSDASSQTSAKAAAQSAEAREPQQRARSAPAQTAGASSGRSASAEATATPRAAEEASALPGPQGGAPTSAASASDDQPAASDTILWPDPPPLPQPQQADAMAGQSIATKVSNAADAGAIVSEAAPQNKAPVAETAAAEPAPTAASAPTANLPAQADPPADVSGSAVENVLILAFAMLLAVLVFAVIFVARRRRADVREATSFARFGSGRRYRPYQAGDETANGERDIRYTEAREGSLVPEQVTMPRPFAPHVWQRRELRSRHGVE